MNNSLPLTVDGAVSPYPTVVPIVKQKYKAPVKSQRSFLQVHIYIFTGLTVMLESISWTTGSIVISDRKPIRR